MKITLDTNMLVRANEVLRYPHIKRLTQLTEGQIAEYIGFLSEVAELVDIGPPIPFAAPDADDWIVLRTAIRGDVDVLCSLDGHLRRDDLASVYEHYHFNVMTDVEALRLLRVGA